MEFPFVFQLAEKYFVKGGDPRAAIEMYTKANMYEAAHKVIHSHCQVIFFSSRLVFIFFGNNLSHAQTFKEPIMT